MSATLDSVPGQWTLWVRIEEGQTNTYQASFSGGPNSGSVTVTSPGTSCTVDWQQGANENVTFSFIDQSMFPTPAYFFGYMVGLAMGGTISHIPGTIGEYDPIGTWSAYKTSD